MNSWSTMATYYERFCRYSICELLCLHKDTSLCRDCSSGAKRGGIAWGVQLFCAQCEWIPYLRSLDTVATVISPIDSISLRWEWRWKCCTCWTRLLPVYRDSPMHSGYGRFIYRLTYLAFRKWTKKCWRIQYRLNDVSTLSLRCCRYTVEKEYGINRKLKVFAPHTAAELYAAVQQVQPIEMKTAARLAQGYGTWAMVLLISRVSEQPWPEVDADAIIDLTLHVWYWSTISRIRYLKYRLQVNGVNCGRAPVQRPLVSEVIFDLWAFTISRIQVEDLSLEELITRASTHEHKSMIDWLREKQGVIKKATTEGRKGRYVIVSTRKGPDLTVSNYYYWLLQ